MNGKKILAVPAVCFWSVIGVCLLGIGVGSFRDFEISSGLADIAEHCIIFRRKKHGPETA